MMLGTFPAFLTFLPRKLCLPALRSDPWQGLEISSCLRRGPLRRPAFVTARARQAALPDRPSTVWLDRACEAPWAVSATGCSVTVENPV